MTESITLAANIWDRMAGFAGGNFYNEPEPAVRLYPPLRGWHWGKILFEKWWLHHWF
ncbi:MAG: hypothetical protein ACYC6B_08170 [Thermoleophilia bacterium]